MVSTVYMRRGKMFLLESKSQLGRCPLPETPLPLLLRLMDERNMTQADLARLSGLTPGAISNILNGKRQAGADALYSIAVALRVPPEMLYQEAGFLPKEDDETLLERRFRALLKRLPEDRRVELLRYAEYLAERSKGTATDEKGNE